MPTRNDSLKDRLSRYRELNITVTGRKSGRAISIPVWFVALTSSASVARSQPYYLDITHPLANKGAAFSEIANLLGVPLSEIAAIGDGSNDVAMFERSGLSIAMGNASPQVQQAADFVTDCNSEDGFANAIERFIVGDNHSNERVRVARAIGRA